MLEATARAEERHFWFRGLRRNASRLLDGALGGRAPRLIIDCGAGTGRNLDWLRRRGPAVGVERAPIGLRVGHAAGRRSCRDRSPICRSPTRSRTSRRPSTCSIASTTPVSASRSGKCGGCSAAAASCIVNVAALDVLRGSHSTLTMEVRRYTPRRLRAALEGAGFRVERMTFTNMATFPVTLGVRGLQRLTGRASEASDADLRVPSAPINAALDAALRIEGALLRVVNLPIGSSLMAVARKRGRASPCGKLHGPCQQRASDRVRGVFHRERPVPYFISILNSRSPSTRRSATACLSPGTNVKSSRWSGVLRRQRGRPPGRRSLA